VFRVTFQFIQDISRYIGVAIAAAVIVTTGAATSEAVTRTWDGGAADNSWQAANWVGDLAPVAGDDLVFPAGVADKATLNDFPAGTEFTSIAVDGPGYSISGNRILLASAIVKTGSGDARIFCGITLKGGANGGSPDVTLSVASEGALIVNGVIDGSGAVPATLLIDGGGWLELRGANTYTGLTTVSWATVAANHAQALGDAAAGTSVGDGSLILDADVLSEPLTLTSTLDTQTLTCQGRRCAPRADQFTLPVRIRA
jgi:autotransporter-associated beta strand protein